MVSSIVSNLKSPPIHLHRKNLLSLHFLLPSYTPSFPFSHHGRSRLPNCALKARFTSFRIWGCGEDRYNSTSANVVRKFVVSPTEDSSTVSDDCDGEGDSEGGERGGKVSVDWEDPILEDTVPIVGFVRMILHSGKYQSGDRLSPEHEKNILERLLPYHPECEKKIGCGIDYIMVGYHPDYETSRCLFIVRKDGEVIDFSYWKCIKGLVKKKYPLYADSFIQKHFRLRKFLD